MSREFSNFIKGMGTGMVAGMAIITTGTMIMKNNKQARKKVNNTLKTVSGIVDTVSYMMK